MDDKTIIKAAGLGDSDEASRLMREYGVPILIGLVVALLALGGYQLYRVHRRSVNERSLMLLNQARDTTQMREIVTLYPSTPAAPVALLSLATQHYRNGDYEQAQQTYRQFAEQYPQHPMKEIAAYGMACCLEASGLSEQALDAFTAFEKEHPDHYLAPLAALGKGRCLDQLGRLGEAKTVYEDFIAAHPESPWRTDAESLLLTSQQGLRAGNTTTTRTAAAPAPAAAPLPMPIDFGPASSLPPNP